MKFVQHAKKGLTAALVLAASQLAAAQAVATVINFEDIPANTYVNDGQSVVSQGYRVTENGYAAFADILGRNGQGASSFSGNGSSRLVGFNNSAITIASVTNNPFNLFNFDGGESWISQPHYWATQIMAVGTYASGGTTTQIFDLDLIKNPLTGLQTFTLNYTFRNLQSVTFRGIGGNPEFSLDNISVKEVPEPASMALLVLGALGLAAARRKHART